jgi:hypothetical protein
MIYKVKLIKVAQHLGYDKIIIANIDALIHIRSSEGPFYERIIELAFAVKG